MGYSIALITKDEEQAEEILNYINKKIPKISEVFEDASEKDDFKWDIGVHLPYINHINRIGIMNSTTYERDSIYLFSLFYFLAHKFGATETINGKEYAIIDYDGSENWILSQENPFKDKESSYGFVEVNDEGIKTSEKKYFYKLLTKTFSHEKKVLELINSFK